MNRIFAPCQAGRHHECAGNVHQSSEWKTTADHLVSVDCGCVCHGAQKTAPGTEEVTHAR